MLAFTLFMCKVSCTVFRALPVFTYHFSPARFILSLDLESLPASTDGHSQWKCSRGWSSDSMLLRTGYSCNGSRFSSKHPHGSPQPPVTLVAEDPDPLLTSSITKHHAYIHAVFAIKLIYIIKYVKIFN